MRALGVLYLVFSLGAGCAVSDATSAEEAHGSASADALVEKEPEPSEETQRPVIEDVEEPPSEQACSSGPRWGAELTLFRERDRALEVYNWEGAPLEVPGFTHSVASGDPRSDRVILWTRFEAAVDDLPVDVYWEVAIDADFDTPVASGWTTTGAERDYTVKVDALGLAAGASYYYRFRALGHDSPIGRTRTSAVGCLERLRVAVASCASYARGYFKSYRDIALEPDLDVVLHLGDYIYEYGGSSVRAIAPPWETINLTDYRLRYAHYRSDPDLQEAHRQHPWIVVWDDHESANDAYAGGAQNHNAGEGDWEARKAIAAQVYSEWMPIRDDLNPLKIWRSFSFGDLMDLVMLDTRIWARSSQGTWDDPSEFLDPTRTLLGEDQQAWLAERLKTSKATWAFIGQQVMVGQLQVDNFAFNPDQWDGYAPSRDALFDAIEAGGAESTVVLTGDIHSSWGIDLARTPQDPATYDSATGAGALAVEFVAPGVTSGVDIDNDLLEFVDWESFAPHVRYRDVEHRGYLVLDVTQEDTEALWYHLDNVADPEATTTLGHSMAVTAAVPHVFDVDTTRGARENAPPLAP